MQPAEREAGSVDGGLPQVLVAVTGRMNAALTKSGTQRWARSFSS